MADGMAINDALLRIQQWLQQGQLGQAEAAARQLVQTAPRVADAWYALGAVLLRKGANSEAEAALRQAVALHPDRAVLWNDLSVACLRQGRAADAESSARQALAQDATNAGSWLGLANALFAQRNWSESSAAYQRGLQGNPQNPAAWNNLAAALQKQGDLAGAQAAYESSLALAPHHLGGLANYACLLFARGDEARATQILSDALERAPASLEAYLLLGYALMRLGNLELAEQAYRRAVELDPKHREARYNLALALEQQWALGEAEALVRQVVDDFPDYADAWALLSGIAQAQCRLDESLAALQRSIEIGPDPGRHSRLLLGRQYVDDVAPAELLSAHQEFDRLYAQSLRSPPPIVRTTTSNRPLRLGFVSADIRQHPTSFLVLPALEHLDKRHCSIVCYAAQLQEDEYTARWRAIADHWRPTLDLNAEEVAGQIREDEIDVLFDLMGHTGHNQLLVLARKPAPLQITWFGYAGTTGLAAMDCLLADRFHVRPGEERFFSEQVLRMPHGYACYQAPRTAPEVGPLPALAAGYVTFGSFNSPAKFSRRTLDAWSAVLHRVPNAKLLLKYGALDLPHVQVSLRARFGERGIAAERILLEGWSPHAELLAAYQRVDLALDTQPYAGGLTTCEALWMGVPTITCPGKTFAGRHSVSYLSNAGLTQFIAADENEFVELAVQWANQVAELSQIRATLREKLRQSPVCNAPQFAQDFLSLIRHTWEQRTS